MGFHSLTVRIQSGISSAGTKAVEMKTTGNRSSENVLVACSLFVSRAGMKLMPAIISPK